MPNGTLSWQREHHGDLGALRERVTGAERALGELRDQVATNQRDTARQIETLQNNLSTQIREMSSSFTAARTTNWGTILTAMGVVIALGAAILSPINSDLHKSADEIEKLSDSSVRKDDYRRSQDELNNWAASLRDRMQSNEVRDNETRIALARLEGVAAERHETYLRDHNALMARVDSIDSNLIKRPEIDSIVTGLRENVTANAASANDRITSVIGSLNELRRDFGANFTIGDAVKELQARVNGWSTVSPPQQTVTPSK